MLLKLKKHFSGLRMQLVASIGIDAFANRTAVRVPGSQVTFATPRFAPWLGLGLGWEMKP